MEDNVNEISNAENVIGDKICEDRTVCRNYVKPRKETGESVTIIPSYDEEEEDWSLFGVSVNKVHLFVREFSVFFIIVETCLLLMGYCVIFGAQLTVQHGYRYLSSKRSNHQDGRGPNRYNGVHAQDIDINNNNHLYNQQMVPVVIPRNRMIGG